MTNIYTSTSASLETLTGPVVQGPLPALTIFLAPPADVIVSWPNTGAYLLQTNNNLGGTNWSTYGGTVTTTNGTNSVTIAQPGGSLYFRLAL